MRISYLKFRRWLLLALLGVMGIGVSSCEKYGSPEDDYDGPRPMYGVIQTEYNENR